MIQFAFFKLKALAWPRHSESVRLNIKQTFGIMQGLRVCSRVLLIYVDTKRLVLSPSAEAEINVYFIDVQIHSENFPLLFRYLCPDAKDFMAKYQFPELGYFKKKIKKFLRVSFLLCIFIYSSPKFAYLDI